MNKRLKALSCALVAIFALTIAVDSPKLGPFGVDAVSAATKEYTAPKPTTPSTSSNSSTHYTSSTNNMSTSFTRLLKFNSIGGDVKLLQTKLSSYGYSLNFDGIFGAKTLAAVKDFQSKHDLTVDGLAGTATLARLTPKVIVKTVVTNMLKLGSTDSDVKLLQSRLSSYGYRLNSDGIFGNRTLVAVKDFQKKHALIADGIVGPATIAKLFKKTVTPAKPVTPTKPATPPVVVVPPVVDVVTAASLVDNAAVFEKSIGKDGKWIIATTKDLVSTKDLVLDGEFKNGKKDAVTGAELIQRKIALYTQDDKRVVTARFTLTAPKLTIKSPMSSIEHGTFKGDLYVSATNFKLVDAKVEGNVYFTTQVAKDTFTKDAKSSITGKQELLVADTVTTASIVDNATAFEKAIGTESTGGKWIAAILNDVTTTKDLVLDGNFLNTKVPAVSQRKIALYSQDDKHVTTAKFTLTAPKLTIKSPDASIQKGTFKGDIYVSAINFKLVDAKVDGNVYFTTQVAKDTFTKDATSSITGTQELIQIDAVTSASLVNDVAAFENAISKNGNWIASVSKDLTTTKELVLDGDKLNTKVPPVSQRKIALYSQDDKRATTRRFTLTAPKLTIKSVDASIEKGIFVGDIYVSAVNFKLIDAKVVGNVCFTTQAAKDTFIKDATSTITGEQKLMLMIN